jgi:LPPG:FO 2-phospho-L-lactate transferase
MRITVLSGGIGGARFLTGLREVVDAASDTITVVGNTADDIWLFGLRVCPDLDTVMYTLGDGIDVERGWGRRDETWLAKEELAAYGVEPSWFGLGDRDIATHLVRTQMLNAGFPLSAVTQALCARWKPGVELLPMTDDRVETHVVIEDPEAEGGRRAVHFQEYWVRLHAPKAYAVRPVGADEAHPAPGVVEAILDADVVILPPSNPVVSIGTILAVPGIADSLRSTAASVVGVSPIIAGAPVRGMADRLLPVIGVDVTAVGVGGHYGARSEGGLLDGWLVDTADADAVPVLESVHLRTRAVPLLMSDLEATRAIARATLDLGRRARATVA